MGSGNRIKFYKNDGFCLGIFLNRFPFSLTATVSIVFWTISIGFGKGYDK